MKTYFCPAMVLCIFFFSLDCGNTSLERAKLELRFAREPIALSGHPENYSNTLIISETNGVGGNIISIDIALWVRLPEYHVFDTISYPGKRFRAYESWQVEYTHYIKGGPDGVLVSITGIDDNGFSFTFAKPWNISYPDASTW